MMMKLAFEHRNGNKANRSLPTVAKFATALTLLVSALPSMAQKCDSFPSGAMTRESAVQIFEACKKDGGSDLMSCMKAKHDSINRAHGIESLNLGVTETKTVKVGSVLMPLGKVTKIDAQGVEFCSGGHAWRLNYGQPQARTIGEYVLTMRITIIADKGSAASTARITVVSTVPETKTEKH